MLGKEKKKRGMEGVGSQREGKRQKRVRGVGALEEGGYKARNPGRMASMSSSSSSVFLFCPRLHWVLPGFHSAPAANTAPCSLLPVFFFFFLLLLIHGRHGNHLLLVFVSRLALVIFFFLLYCPLFSSPGSVLSLSLSLTL
ncbi:MAG: hypothetical protein J3R72DRAFT_444777 [Linnemannia gamsii]|nr:MAG: hypothetical protein J3R72DRAFT_444777 [Linnemannia gamsii]